MREGFLPNLCEWPEMAENAAPLLLEELIDRKYRSTPFIVTRRAFCAALSLSRACRIFADHNYAGDVLKVEETPTFFIDDQVIVGEASFEEFDKRIKPLLKN